MKTTTDRGVNATFPSSSLVLSVSHCPRSYLSVVFFDKRREHRKPKSGYYAGLESSGDVNSRRRDSSKRWRGARDAADDSSTGVLRALTYFLQVSMT